MNVHLTHSHSHPHSLINKQTAKEVVDSHTYQQLKEFLPDPALVDAFLAHENDLHLLLQLHGLELCVCVCVCVCMREREM
jgi:hypothetical protein